MLHHLTINSYKSSFTSCPRWLCEFYSSYCSCESLKSLMMHIVSYQIFRKMEKSEPFERKIQPEEWWMYRNPPTPDYVPGMWLLPMTFVIQFTVVLLTYFISKDRNDFSTANNVVTLAIALNGFTTSLFKVTIGRPRPDFYYRCFPNGTKSFDGECYGDAHDIQEGRKSFPSGHSSCKYFEV